MSESASPSFLPDRVFLDRAIRSGLPVRDEVVLALERGEVPERYRRNGQSISLRDQIRLGRARVLVVGCGGLGGYVLEHLARAGVGTIRACDPDTIELHNANRQLLATGRNIGQVKVEAASERVAAINPLVCLEPLPEPVRPEMLRGAQVVVDCLGGVSHRKTLQTMAAEAGVNLVSAAVSGWTALISTTWPHETGLAELMDGGEHGSELVQGIPGPVVGFAASLQAAEVLRIIAGLPSALRGNLLVADLSTMRFSIVGLQTRIR